MCIVNKRQANIFMVYIYSYNRCAYVWVCLKKEQSSLKFDYHDYAIATTRDSETWLGGFLLFSSAHCRRTLIQLYVCVYACVFASLFGLLLLISYSLTIIWLWAVWRIKDEWCTYIHMYTFTDVHIFLLIIYCFHFERVAKCVQLFCVGPWPSAAHAHTYIKAKVRCFT